MYARLNLGDSKKILSESPIGKLVMLKLTVFALFLSQLVPVALTSYFEAFGESACEERLGRAATFERVEGRPIQPVTRSLAGAPVPLPVEAVVSIDLDVAECLRFEGPNGQLQAIRPNAQHDCERAVMPGSEQLSSEQPEPVSATASGLFHVRCGRATTSNPDDSLLR